MTDEVQDDTALAPEAPTPEAYAELQAKLEAAEATSARLTTLVADPDVSAVVDAKEHKRSLRVVVGDETPEEEDAPLPPLDSLELEGMSNAQLAESILARVGGEVRTSLSALGIAERVEELATAHTTARRAALTAEAQGLMEKYPDFAGLAEEIKPLAKSGLKLEEAYLVARMRSGKGMPEAKRPSTHTERPTGVQVERRKDTQKPARPGARGFADDLAETVEDVFSRLELPTLLR